METAHDGGGCLAGLWKAIARVLAALLNLIAGFLRLCYDILLRGFQFSQIQNKSGFVLFWITATVFCLVGFFIAGGAGSDRRQSTAQPLPVTVEVTRLVAQLVTATPTRTAVATATATRTPTPLSPEMQTSVARAATETALALGATASQQAASDHATATVHARQVSQTAVAHAATATRLASDARGTATVQAYSDYATLVAQYTRIPVRDLVTYPNTYIGEKVMVQGWVFNVNSDQELQMYIRGTYDAIYVVMDSPFDDIYEDMSITVYGTVAGESCGTNLFGGEVCQPLLVNAFYER